MKSALLLCAIGDRYEKMAIAAASRWRELLPELYIACIADSSDAAWLHLPALDPTRAACLLKLHAWHLVPPDIDAILYADLDILPIAPRSPAAALAGVDFACVRDRWDDPEVARVAATIGLPAHEYFNAGLIYARRSTAPMFDAAIADFDRPKWYDQTALNLARARSGLRTAWLPWSHNVMDCHDAGYAVAASHAPHLAFPAWESGHFPAAGKMIDIAALLDSLDYSHGYTTSPGHLLDLHDLAAGRRHCLDIGTFRGHSALAMAAAGNLVTSIDPGNLSRRVFDPALGLSYDAFQSTSAAWIDADTGTYDMIYHDAEHGPEIIPELERCWSPLQPGGILAIHDAEQLDGWAGQTLQPPPAARAANSDTRGRQLLILDYPGQNLC